MKNQIAGLLVFLFCITLPTNCQTEWKTGTNRPLSGPCKAVTYKGKIYVASTHANRRIVIEEYSPITDTWVLKKATSHTENGGEFCAAATDAGIFFMGGWIDTSINKIGKGISLDKMEKYDVERDTFLVLGRMPTGLDCATAISVDDIIYVMGGRAKDNTPLSDAVYAYDPEMAVWSKKHGSSPGRVEAYTVVVDGKIYLFGGYCENATHSDIMIDNKMDVYDPVSDSWKLGESDLVDSNKNPLGMGMIQNEVYFLVMATGAEELFKYNPESRSTVRLTDRSDLTWLMGTVSLNDSIYFIGGIKGDFPNGEQQNSTLILKSISPVSKP